MPFLKREPAPSPDMKAILMRKSRVQTSNPKLKRAGCNSKHRRGGSVPPTPLHKLLPTRWSGIIHRCEGLQEDLSPNHAPRRWEEAKVCHGARSDPVAAHTTSHADKLPSANLQQRHGLICEVGALPAISTAGGIKWGHEPKVTSPPQALREHSLPGTPS